jgi:two-component sensor histidine kinase
LSGRNETFRPRPATTGMTCMLRMASWPGEAPRPSSTSHPPPVVRFRTAWARWLLALAIWCVAFAARWSLTDIADSGPFLTFLPAIALTTLLCGRWPALAVIAAATVACDYWWLPPAGFAMDWPTTPVSLVLFIFIGLFELVLVDALYRSSRGDADQSDHAETSLRLRETMVDEMRHRVTNQLHVITAMLEGSQINIDGGARADDVLEQAIGRIASITHLQRIVDDKASYRRGLAPVLRDMLDHIFYDVDVAIQVRVPPVNLSTEHMTIVCLIVIEAAMNSLKHIFRRRRGHMFAVELRRLLDDRLSLTIWDDGPGFDAGSAIVAADGTGLSIMHGLTGQLGGRLSIESRGGTTVTVEFDCT